jgi:Domain of unknown function (DUF4376)
MTRTCIIDAASGAVVNVVDLGAQPPTPTIAEATSPPLGFLFMPSDTAGIGWSLVDGVLVAPPPPPPPPPTPELLAAKRYAVETGGTTWNTWPVATGRDDRGNLQAEYIAAKDGTRTDGDPWKFVDGQFRALTNAQIIDMALAVRAFVRACYAVETQKLTLIDQGLDPAIDTGWP